MDLEMTGLDEKTDRILEVAALVSDLEFKELGRLQEVVFQPQEIIDNMNDWCKKTHGESGLTALIPTGKPLAKVEQQLITLLDKYFSKNDRVVIAGNSIGNDRRFIDAYLPQFAKRLHYRMIDVSSFKEVFREKYKVEYKKQNAHRAIDDIGESIGELKHYLSFVKI